MTERLNVPVSEESYEFPIGSFCDLFSGKVYGEGEKTAVDFYARISQLNAENRYSEILIDQVNESLESTDVIDLSKIDSVVRRHERGIITTLWISALAKQKISTDQLLEIWNDVDASRETIGEAGHLELDARIESNTEE